MKGFVPWTCGVSMMMLRDIVRLLDEDNEKVIVTLLEQRIVQDRRVNPNEALEGARTQEAGELRP